jgi:hypothetical protein
VRWSDLPANIKINSDSKKFQEDMKKLTQDLKLMESGLATATLKAELFGSAEDKLGAQANELGQKLKSQIAIIDMQKQAIVALTGDIQKYRDRNEVLKTSIAETEKKIKDSIKATGDDSAETKKLTSELAKLQSEYAKNDKEIAKATKSQSDLTLKVAETEREMLKNQKVLQDNSKETQNLANENTKLNKTMDDVKVAFGLIGVASLNYLKNAVTGVAKAEPSIKVLTRALENQGMTTEEATKGMKEFNKTVISMSTFTGGEAREALAVLTRKGVDLGIALKNASVITDTAKGMNIGLAESADIVASAYNGKTRALMQLGILTKEEIKNMEGQENAGLRLNEIQKRLEERFSGSAKAEMESFNGQLKLMSNAFNGLKATIGNALLPTLTGFATSLNEALKPIVAFLKENPKIVAMTLAIVGLLGVLVGGVSLFNKLSGIFTSLIPMFAPIMSFLSGLSAPMLLIVVGIGLLIVAIVNMWKTSEEFRDNVMALWKGLMDFFKGLFKTLKSWWDDNGWIIVNIFKEIIAVVGFILVLFSKMSPELVKIIGMLIGLAVVVAPIVMLAISAGKAISGFTGFLGIFGMTGKSTTIIILGVVAALIALGVVIAILMGKSSEMNSTFKNIGDSTKNIATGSSSGNKLQGINIPKFATGINYVPNDMVAMIHEGESIVPKKYNKFNPNELSKLVHTVQGLKQQKRAMGVR